MHTMLGLSSRSRHFLCAVNRNCIVNSVKNAWKTPETRVTTGNPFADSTLDQTKLPYNIERTYKDEFQYAIDYPEEYWDEQAKKIVWFKKYSRVLDHDQPPFTKWFVGGETNNCYNALDRHVDAGLGDVPALIYDSPITGHKRDLTYKEMLDRVSLLSAVLHKHGVKHGDRVLIYMPMIPQAIMSMLACARLGAIHIVVFGGFAAKELSVRINHSQAIISVLACARLGAIHIVVFGGFAAKDFSVRINHSQPKVILSASAGAEPNRVIEYKPILDEAVGLSDWKPDACIIYNRKHVQAKKLTHQKGRDFDWDSEMDAVPYYKGCVSVPATDPLYIIHTSGTTGLPKGIVRPSGGHAVVLPWTMQHVYAIRPGEVWWAASDLGWVVGHSYICYAPLLYGATSILYEGKPVGTPNAGQFFRVVCEHDAVSFFCAPTALRAIHQADPDVKIGSKYNMPELRTIFSAGEHLDSETRHWAEKKFQVPVLDHWWQTESGFPICASCIGYPGANLNPPKDASGTAVPGWNVQVLDDGGKPVEADQLGRIVVQLPLPPGSLSTFWGRDDKFKETYFQQFPGYYDTADAGMKSSDGYVSVMSRVDDVMNVAGHRLSSGGLEEAILDHEIVVDCAVIGVNDKLKGTVPVALCVLRDDFRASEETVAEEVVKLVRDKVGAVAALKTVIVIPKLPKTRSGKIARNTMAAMANSEPYQVPVTIEDASVYPIIHEKMMEVGLGLYGVEAGEPSERPMKS